MNNLLALGKSMVKEMKYQYKDSFYCYVNENSFEDKTYIDIATKLFENKEKFLDYMNYLYVENFDWLNSEVNSFDFIQELVDIKVSESGKYIWHDNKGQFVPVIEYTESLKNMYKDEFPTPCCVKNLTTNKEVFIDSYDDYNKGYNVLGEDKDEELYIFLEEGVDDIYDYLESELSTPTIELNGMLNMYYEIDPKVWSAKVDDEYMENRITHQKENVRDLFEKCIDELIENNPDVLKKYGLNQILLNVHEVNVQEV